jgi:hypothetical protein
MLNLESTILASKLSQITCPVHEWCNGTCATRSGLAQISFEPLLCAGRSFEVTPLAFVSFPEPSLLTEPPPATIKGLGPFKYAPLDSDIAMIRLTRLKSAIFLADLVRIELLDVSPQLLLLIRRALLSLAASDFRSRSPMQWPATSRHKISEWCAQGTLATEKPATAALMG